MEQKFSNIKISSTNLFETGFSKEDVIKKLEQLPEEFSSPKNPKGIAYLKNKEGDLAIDFLENIQINFPCFHKCSRINYEKPDKISAEFHYKETNYFLNFE